MYTYSLQLEVRQSPVIGANFLDSVFMYGYWFLGYMPFKDAINYDIKR